MTKKSSLLISYLILMPLIHQLWAQPENPLIPPTVSQDKEANAQISVEPSLQSKADKTKPCFQCNGTNKMKCAVSSCINGQIDCPDTCLKLSTPGWQHLDIPGHSPDELWMKFPDEDGKGYYSWTQKHIGQIVRRQNGKATITEMCPTCQGKAHVMCNTCNGIGVTVCTICDGSGTVPQSWTAFDNPKLKKRPGCFKLKDGNEVIGRKVIETQDSITVRTEKGSVLINKADLAPENPQQ
jgi:hypothetical protein